MEIFASITFLTLMCQLSPTPATNSSFLPAISENLILYQNESESSQSGNNTIFKQEDEITNTSSVSPRTEHFNPTASESIDEASHLYQSTSDTIAYESSVLNTLSATTQSSDVLLSNAINREEVLLTHQPSTSLDAAGNVTNPDYDKTLSLENVLRTLPQTPTVPSATGNVTNPDYGRTLSLENVLRTLPQTPAVSSTTEYVTNPDYDRTLSLENVFRTLPQTPEVSSTTENVTSFEETVEHNAILTPDFEDVTDKGPQIIVGHKCTKLFQESILWNDTDGGMLALKSCPRGYQGNMYRSCFSSGKWGKVDYSECRLEHLGRMRHMIFHQVQKRMFGNMYKLVDDFSKYISSVDMKSPMDRLEAFEILNTFLKLDMNLKMDKTRDIKYIQSLLYSSNELIKKKTVLFPPGSQKNKLISEKAVDMVFDLTYLAERALRGLLNTQKKQIAFRSSSNVVLYLYRGKLSRQFSLMNFSSEYDKDDELSSFFNLEKTLERSAYALIWIKGLNDLLSETKLLVNSDIAVATILSPLNSLNHLKHPPTFDIGLRLKKEVPDGYVLKCGQLWNMSHLWNTQDCLKANVKGDIVTCRCHHLGSIALLLEEIPQSSSSGLAPPIGNLIVMSCVISLCAILFSLIVHTIIQRKENSVSSFILISILLCMTAIQVILIFGVNSVAHFETCLMLAILLHYLFLKSCFWVVSYSIYLLRRLRSGMEYSGRIRDYCAACWILPLLWLIVSFIANSRGYETKQFCWLNVQKGIVWSFVVPVTGLILVNTVVMILALKTFSEQMSVTHRNEIYKTRTSIRAGITLLPFLAINWFFGILAVEDSGNIALQAVFFFTNAMQGIMTLIFFCVMDNNVQMFFRMKLGEVSKKPKISAMKMRKSGSFPVMERSLISFTEDGRRQDCTPLLASRSAYHETPEDPCCSNIRV